MKIKLALLVAALFAATEALANWSSPIEVNPGDASLFDTIAVYSTSGAGLATPTNTAFNDGSWSEIYSSASWAFAQGNSVTDLKFTINFLGDSSSPLSIDFAVWNNGVFNFSQSAVWTPVLNNYPGYWSYPAASKDYSYPSLPNGVPDAASTLALLGGAFLGLAALRRRIVR